MIYLDVDGVIADFEMGVRALGWAAGDSEQLEEFMARNYEQIFRTAPPTNNMRFFQQMYQAQIACSVNRMKLLTAMGSHYKKEHIQTVKENKYWWLEQFGFLREDIIIVPQAADKLKYCQPGDVLYDDKRWTIERWKQVRGHGFLVYYHPSWSSNEN